MSCCRWASRLGTSRYRLITVMVPLLFRISWNSASPFSFVSQVTVLGGFPLEEVQVATKIFSVLPDLAISGLLVPSIQFVGLAAGECRKEEEEEEKRVQRDG